MHPDTIATLGLADTPRVDVMSAVGRVTAHVRPDRTVRRDVVLFNPAHWQGELSGVNQLREARVTDLGDSAAMHATTVAVQRA